MYEKRNQALISAKEFRARLAKHLLFALVVLSLSIAVGTFGHVYFEGMSWSQAFLSSCFLLSGLGLAIFPETNPGQLFTSLFALYAGFVFIAINGIILAPILHRFLHRFNWVSDDEEN